MRRPRTKWGVLAAGALVIAGVSGCEVPGIEPDAAQELQGQVSEVTDAAEEGNYEQALVSLDDLSLRLQTATRSGEVSLSRHERISGAIDAVRLTLETEIALRENPGDPSPAPATGGN
ncbi:hypothetical protein J2M53_13910 [Arthrobacter sp. zg-ZUI100]|uniref:hypothetical protein n=1 Tax=Arthrobacter jiangjiafuii TaxID=2817475 RepID=UPI001AEE5AAE|nr:hypothetical protein [Arthrobacter jiangjiafuii]MBP3037340.1 hypothetical protein [Arthrobacter jiangjiafuii]